MNRRDFLRLSAVGASSLYAQRLWGFEPLSVANPLGVYPNRGWEEVYRDQYRVDESFTWVCAPNDTHMCRLRAFVRNGVILRSEQNYDHDKCGDLYGNHATKAWNPRGCPKGFTMQRRVYGPYRLKGPVLRKGWKERFRLPVRNVLNHADLLVCHSQGKGNKTAAAESGRDKGAEVICALTGRRNPNGFWTRGLARDH